MHLKETFNIEGLYRVHKNKNKLVWEVWMGNISSEKEAEEIVKNALRHKLFDKLRIVRVTHTVVFTYT